MLLPDDNAYNVKTHHSQRFHAT